MYSSTLYRNHCLILHVPHHIPSSPQSVITTADAVVTHVQCAVCQTGPLQFAEEDAIDVNLMFYECLFTIEANTTMVGPSPFCF